MAQEEDVTLKLDGDEALVLFEYLSRVAEAPERPGRLAPGELSVLNVLICYLERSLVAPLAADYTQRLDRARNRIVERWSGSQEDS